MFSKLFKHKHLSILFISLAIIHLLFQLSNALLEGNGLAELTRSSCRLADRNVNKLEWWKKTNYYHIYIRSFKDSDGDGQGDIRGIVQELDYLSTIGVGTVLLSPFYSSPMHDGGYDVDDYYKVNQRFGTMKDLEDLIAGLKERNMHLVVDFVPNHTSHKHKWFECSERALLEPERCAKYRDYYVWSNSTKSEGGVPTNWKSLFHNGESVWTWSEIRKEFYMHQFLPEQPDLNVSNPNVQEELKTIARFWLAKGADGLRLDAVLSLFEDTIEWRDEPLNPDYNPNKDPNKYNSLIHIYTKSLYASAKLTEQWQKVAQEFSDDRVIIAEAYDIIPKIIEYYGPSPNEPFANMPFNFDLITMLNKDNLKPIYLEEILVNWVQALQDMLWPTHFGAFNPWSIYVTGNHDNSRAWNRVGSGHVELLKWISYLMPAAPVDYYGDELAIKDANYSSIPKKTIDEGETTRLAFRVPMAWTGEEPSAGFSRNSDIWMPLNDDWKVNNVAELLRESNVKNSLKNFITLTSIRKLHIESILFGDLIFFRNNPHISEWIFSMARPLSKDESSSETAKSLMMISNLNPNERQTLDLLARESQLRHEVVEPPIGEVLVELTNFDSQSIRQGQKIKLKHLRLEPTQAMIVSW